MSDNVFAERLRTLREQKKFSQERLAELINVSIMTVRRWEWGQRLPRLDEMKKLTDILNVKADELLNGSPNDKIRVTLSYDVSKLKEGEIDMDSNGFDLFLGKNGRIGLQGAAMITSKEAIEVIVAQIREQLVIGLEAQKRRGVIPED